MGGGGCIGESLSQNVTVRTLFCFRHPLVAIGAMTEKNEPKGFAVESMVQLSRFYAEEQ